jgi:hypothetical protein
MASRKENMHGFMRWLAETCRLERAIHNFALGRSFRGEKPPEAAIRFYDRSLACPVTDLHCRPQE